MDEICSLQSSRNFDERVLSIFLTKIMAAIFDFNGSGRLVRERNLYQGDSRQSKIRRGVGVGQWKSHLLALPPPPTSTVHSNSKSNMAGQINNYELIKLACCYKTPALQAMRFVETEWLGCWTCSLVILGSGSLFCYSMNLFSVFSTLCALNSLAAFCTNPTDLLSASCSF